ncbi:Uncharacterised protein [Mycobacteroides abscessus subsp. massiliense]|nr:Uncharacterised protein [Mycobacteroides abscessus subsp. massiliense]
MLGQPRAEPGARDRAGRVSADDNLDVGVGAVALGEDALCVGHGDVDGLGHRNVVDAARGADRESAHGRGELGVYLFNEVGHGLHNTGYVVLADDASGAPEHQPEVAALGWGRGRDAQRAQVVVGHLPGGYLAGAALILGCPGRSAGTELVSVAGQRPE